MSAGMNAWRWSVLGLVCAASPQARGQTAGAVTQFSFPGVAASSAKKSVGVQLDKDFNRDVATLLNGQVMFQFAPDLMDLSTKVTFSGTVNDLCEVPNCALAERGAVALATTTGVVLYGMNPSTHQLGVLATYATSSPVTAIQWVDRNDVETAFDLAVIENGGLTVRMLQIASASIVNAGSFVPTSSQGNSFSAIDLRMLHWNSNGVKDFVLRRAGGIVVCDVSGGYLYQRTAANGYTYAVSMAVVNRSGKNNEYVAWNFFDSALNQQMLRVEGLNNSGVLEVEQVVSLSGYHPFDITTGDFDKNGLRDIIISHRTNPDQVIMLNTSATGQVFSSSVAYFMSLAAPSTSFADHNATPAVADYDNDGDDDIFAPCSVVSARFMFRGTAIDESLKRVTISEQGAGEYDYLRTLVRVDLPQLLLGSATHIQVIAYRAIFPGSQDAPGIQGYRPAREPTPILNVSYPLTAIPKYNDCGSGGSYRQCYANYTGALSWTSTGNHTLYMDSPWTSSQSLNHQFANGEGLLYTEFPNPTYGHGGPAQVPSAWFAVDWLIRLYNVDANGNVTAVHPTKVFTITSDQNYATELAYSTLSTNGTLDVLGLRHIGTGSTGSQSGTGGSGSTRPVDPYSPPPPIPPPSGP